MSAVYEVIRSIAVYLILVTVLLNLVSGNSYRKYVELVCGMVLIVIVLAPITKVLNLEDDFLYHFNFSSFKVNAMDTERFLQAEKAGQEEILKEYKKILEERIFIIAEQNNREVVQTEIVLAEEDYGKIEELTVEVSEGKKEAEEKEYKKEELVGQVEKIQIDKIEISDNGILPEEKKEIVREKNRTTEMIQKALALEFAMEEERILVYEKGE